VERPRSYGRAWDGARRGSGAWPAALTGGDHGSAQNRGGRKREKREYRERLNRFKFKFSSKKSF